MGALPSPIMQKPFQQWPNSAMNTYLDSKPIYRQPQDNYYSDPSSNPNFQPPKNRASLSNIYNSEMYPFPDEPNYMHGVRTLPGRSRQHYTSCSCCESLKEDFGRYNTVSTSTDPINSVDSTASMSLRRTPLENIQAARVSNWQTMNGTDDAIYRPSDRKGSEQNVQTAQRRFRNMEGGLDDTRSLSSRTLLQQSGLAKRLPRSAPLKADYDGFRTPMSTSFCGRSENTSNYQNLNDDALLSSQMNQSDLDIPRRQQSQKSSIVTADRSFIRI